MQQPVLAGKSGKTPTGFIQRFRLLMMTQSINQSVKRREAAERTGAKIGFKNSVSSFVHQLNQIHSLE